MKNEQSIRIRKLTMIALFTAISYVVMVMIHFPISFLTLDIKDAVIALCGLYFGPAATIFASIVVPLIEMVTVSSTGVYGFLMNSLGTLSFALTVSLIYKYRKNFVGAVTGLVCGSFAMTAVMLMMNLLVTPAYFGISVAEVRAMIPTLLLPFNLVKCVLNAAIVLLLYKPVSGLLHKAGVLPENTNSYHFGLRTILVTVVSILLIILSIVVVVLVLGGHLSWGIV